MDEKLIDQQSKQPIHPDERRDAERRAGRALPTDEDVMAFLKEEREYGMREELFNGRRTADPIAEVRGDRKGQ